MTWSIFHLYVFRNVLISAHGKRARLSSHTHTQQTHTDGSFMYSAHGNLCVFVPYYRARVLRAPRAYTTADTVLLQCASRVCVGSRTRAEPRPACNHNWKSFRKMRTHAVRAVLHAAPPPPKRHTAETTAHILDRIGTRAQRANASSTLFIITAIREADENEVESSLESVGIAERTSADSKHKFCA